MCVCLCLAWCAWVRLGTPVPCLCAWLGVPCVHRESGQCQRGERGHPPGPGPDLAGAEQPLSCLGTPRPSSLPHTCTPLARSGCHQLNCALAKSTHPLRREALQPYTVARGASCLCTARTALSCLHVQILKQFDKKDGCAWSLWVGAGTGRRGIVLQGPCCGAGTAVTRTSWALGWD